MVRRVVRLHWEQLLGPVEIAEWVGVATSIVHQVSIRCRINRLGTSTGMPVAVGRNEHNHPLRCCDQRRAVRGHERRELRADERVRL